MSIIWEAEEIQQSGNEGSRIEEADEKQTRDFGEHPRVSQGTKAKQEWDETETILLDDGGGDDTQDEVKSRLSKSSKDEMTGQLLRGQGSVNEDTIESKQNVRFDKNSDESGEEIQVQQIVSQILEDLLDVVVTEIQASYEQSHEELVERGEENDDSLEIDLEAKDLIDQSSLKTIKSVDEGGSIIIDEESKAKSSYEEAEVAVLKKQQHESNISLYHSLMSSRAQLKLRNSFLLKQVYELYRTKKIDHLFIESAHGSEESEGKYIKWLLVYKQVMEDTEEERTKLQRQIKILQDRKLMISLNLEEELNDLLEKERSMGRGLVFSQTAKAISDKTIEKLITRQVSKSQEVARQRLAYFKLRDAVSVDECLLKKLQTLGENLTLMEYEQLKMQSQSCVEKLEERDADLHRLRSKTTSAIQVLAEIREKAQALLEEIEAGKVALHDVNNQLSQTRERLGCDKKKRDMIRSDAVRLRQEAGLLSEPKLMKDYKESVAEKDQLSEHLKELKYKFEVQKKTIADLRKTVATFSQSNV